MKNIIAVLAVAVSAFGLAAISNEAAAADACHNVTFKFTNKHKEGRDIKVVKVKYLNPHNGGKVQTEGVKDITCKPGATCTTSGDNLGDAAKVDIKDIQLVFRYKELDGDWSDEFMTQPFTQTDRKCTENKQYGTIVVYG